MSEGELIAKYLRALCPPEAFSLLDDGAILPDLPVDQEWVMTTDMMVSDVHLPADTDMQIIAQHLLITNLSDIAGMAATPCYLLLQLGLPADGIDSNVKNFVQGVKIMQQQCYQQTQHQLGLLGGDMVGLPIHLQKNGWLAGATIIGKRPKKSRKLRMDVQADDALLVTGTLGDANLGLLLIQNKCLSDEFSLKYHDDYRFLLNRYYLPSARITATDAMQRYANGLMDISDGIYADAGKMLHASRTKIASLGLEIEAGKFPISTAARRFLACYPHYQDAWQQGGGDYELLLTMPADNIDALKQTLPDLPITIIGRFNDEARDNFMDKKQGFDHFAS